MENCKQDIIHHRWEMAAWRSTQALPYAGEIVFLTLESGITDAPYFENKVINVQANYNKQN